MKTFECILRKLFKMLSTKHYVSHYFLLRLRAVGNHYFSIEKLHFEEVHKRKRKILINTVVGEDFWSPFRETIQFWYPKSLVFTVFGDVISPRSQSLLFPREKSILGASQISILVPLGHSGPPARPPGGFHFNGAMFIFWNVSFSLDRSKNIFVCLCICLFQPLPSAFAF